MADAHDSTTVLPSLIVGVVDRIEATDDVPLPSRAEILESDV